MSAAWFPLFFSVIIGITHDIGELNVLRLLRVGKARVDRNVAIVLAKFAPFFDLDCVGVVVPFTILF